MMAGCHAITTSPPSPPGTGLSLFSQRWCRYNTQKEEQLGNPGPLASPCMPRGPLTERKTSCFLCEIEIAKGQGIFHFYKSSSSSSTTICRKLNDHWNIFCIYSMSTSTAFHHPNPQQNCTISNTLPLGSEFSFSSSSFYLALKNLLGFAGKPDIFDMSEFQVLSNDYTFFSGSTIEKKKTPYPWY